jgi:hypothetical protein
LPLEKQRTERAGMAVVTQGYSWNMNSFKITMMSLPSPGITLLGEER